MSSYLITFQLNSPVSFTNKLTFDGLLSYAYAREVLGDSFSQKLSIQKGDVIDFSQMPITIHPDGYFMASYMFYGESIEHTQRWRKRWANKHDHLADFGKRKRKVEVNKGSYKSYDMPLRCVTVSDVWFYFKSDNVDEVRRLVQKWIHFIGKKRSQGYGEIDDFQIGECDFDFQGAYRPIPKRLTSEKGLIQYCGWKPPYWDASNYEECIV